MQTSSVRSRASQLSLLEKLSLRTSQCQYQNSSVAKSVLFKFLLTKQQHAAATIKANSNVFSAALNNASISCSKLSKMLQHLQPFCCLLRHHESFCNKVSGLENLTLKVKQDAYL